jgi:hypothetical protein
MWLKSWVLTRSLFSLSLNNPVHIYQGMILSDCCSDYYLIKIQLIIILNEIVQLK